jgi:hypothetical protein
MSSWRVCHVALASCTATHVLHAAARTLPMGVGPGEGFWFLKHVFGRPAEEGWNGFDPRSPRFRCDFI